MNIVTVTGIFPPDIGGPATYVPRIAAALAERGHTVTVVTLSDRLDHADDHPFRLVRLPRQVPLARRQPLAAAAIARLARAADVLFVNGLALEATIAASLAGRPVVQKVVGDLAWERATNRGWLSDDFATFQGRRYGARVEALRALRAWWTRRAERVIVPSRYLAETVAGWGVRPERVEVIPNAVDHTGPLTAAVVPLDAEVRAVFVGRLIALKRVDGILRAIAATPGVGLVVVGDGPERARLEELARELGLGGRVRFLGALPPAAARAVVAGCDVLTLNSTHEGLPHAALEAMALGLPVVATAVGGVPELVRDGVTGRLVPSGDEAALASALGDLRDPALRRRLGGGAYRSVAGFSRDAMVAATERALLLCAARVPQEMLT